MTPQKTITLADDLFEQMKERAEALIRGIQLTRRPFILPIVPERCINASGSSS
jgi:hypothetical protein